MKQAKPVFVCQECGAQRRSGRADVADCGAWNSFVEERAAGAARRRTDDGIATRCQELPCPARRSTPKSKRRRPIASRTGIGEFDRVLGGGIVPGSLILLGGEPGIGKSTLLLQAAANFAQSVGPVLYASGEESEHQIKSRGDRLGVGDAPLYLLAETCIERILEEVGRVKPALIIVDSVQTVFSLKFQSAPGSIGQVREAATQFLFTAKGHNIPTFLVGHVTKDGSLAGPKALEHVVDTVLYFEGERHHSHRVVRAVKNRFGAVSELGVFEMTGAGLRPVPNPSALFLAERPTATPGSAVLCCLEGSRPLLVEVQALVSTSSYGMARRMAVGIDQNRLSLLLAVLEKRAGLHLVSDDVFVNIAGGMSIDEPAVDLGDRRRRRVEPAQPPDPAGHGGVRRSRAGRRSPRRGAGQPPHPRGRADGIHPHRPAGVEHGRAVKRLGKAELVGVRSVGEALDMLLELTRARPAGSKVAQYSPAAISALPRVFIYGLVHTRAARVRRGSGVLRVHAAAARDRSDAQRRVRRRPRGCCRWSSNGSCATPPSPTCSARFIGGAAGLLLAKGISAALFWVDHGDQRVAFLHSFILLVFPVSRPRDRRAQGRVARAGAADDACFAPPDRSATTRFSTPR